MTAVLDPIEHHLDEARYNALLAGELCEAFAMACAGLPVPQRTGLMAIHRALDDRLESACGSIDQAFEMVGGRDAA